MSGERESNWHNATTRQSNVDMEDLRRRLDDYDAAQEKLWNDTSGSQCIEDVLIRATDRVIEAARKVSQT